MFYMWDYSGTRKCVKGVETIFTVATELLKEINDI